VFSVIIHFSGGGRTDVLCDYSLQRRLGGDAASVLCDSSLQRRLGGMQRVFSVIPHFSDGSAACSGCSL
jgi:hypothetical protein